MRKLSLLLLFAALLAACSQPPPDPAIPTVAVLPTLEPSPTPTDTPIPTWTPSPALTSTPTATPTLTATSFVTDTPAPTDIPPTLEPSATFTPSLTITNTITFTPSPTFTASPELDELGMLALLAERATILPPDQLYNAATLTAVAHAGETLVAGRSAFAATPTPALGTAVLGGLPIASLPPANVVCTVPPPGMLGSAIAADPSLAAQIGCPVGAVFSTTTAAQSFERGTMIYVQGSPSYIYALTSDGRFRRFNDTWLEGVDPETGGESPPMGLLEPKRGFGKVWRDNLDVRGALGWGVTEEQGGTSSAQSFERGRAIYLPQRGETYLFIDDPGGATGSWRALPGSF